MLGSGKVHTQKAMLRILTIVFMFVEAHKTGAAGECHVGGEVRF